MNAEKIIKEMEDITKKYKILHKELKKTTKEVIDLELCRRCKERKGTIKMRKIRNPKSEHKHYLWCTECNTIQRRKYYKKNKIKCDKAVKRSLNKNN